MLLTDRDIAQLIKENRLIENADNGNITNIGYDLTAKYFAVAGKELDAVSLLPGESAFVGAEENISMQNNLAARVVLKNSRIRQGLAIEAPVYQPGHHTKVFFRLTNITGDEITLTKGQKYATILFEQLTGDAAHPYDGTFSEEFDFNGLARYHDIYNAQVKKIEKKAEDLKAMERNIYSNVLVILTVFVALFSFLTTNITLAAQSADATQFLLYNCVMLGCVGFLVALLGNFVGTAKSKAIWFPCIIMFAAALVLFMI